MSEHTPGPWHTGTHEDAHIVYDGDCGFVADAGRDDGEAETEAANARLIAAAPDLLAACERAARQLRERLLNASPWGALLVSDLEEAIALAKGGAS